MGGLLMFSGLYMMRKRNVFRVGGFRRNTPTIIVMGLCEGSMMCYNGSKIAAGR